jgi:hypothetical protein
MRIGARAQRALFAATAALALSLAAAGPWDRADGDARQRMGAVQRLLGPIASAAASVEWARYMSALDQGDLTRAYGHAARALSLDSRATAGWLTLADHFIFIRASPLEEPAPQVRRQWIREGFAVLRSGEQHATTPGILARYAATLKSAFLADLPDERLRWPGGPRALLGEARADLQRAASHGAAGVEDTLSFIEEREAELAADGR